MADREPPPITLTTTTTAPTVQTATTYTIGNRRSRGNSNPNRPNNGNLQLPQQNDNTEPFPALQYPSAPLRQTRSNNTDYFAQPSLQYQAGTRPIGIRRLPSGTDTAHSGSDREKNGISLRRRAHTGPSSRPQSQSDNAFADLAALPSHYEVGLPGGMGTIVEGQEAHHGQQNVDLNSNQAQAQHGGLFDSEAAGVGRSGSRRLRAASNAAKSVFSKMSDDTEEPNLRSGRAQGRNNGNYESDVVDYLDVLDPEVSTLTTLNNVQNAMFVPDIPFLNRYYNRRPTYTLSREYSKIAGTAEQQGRQEYFGPQITRRTSRRTLPPTPGAPAVPTKSHEQQERIDQLGSSGTPDSGMFSEAELTRRASITSHVEDDHFAVLPHGVTLEGWSQDDVQVLDDYVRHMLHSRRSRFKRGMKGFGKYVSKPLGFFVTLYAFLITVFGLIWVLFLIGWIYVADSRRDYVIHIIDSVLVALFAIMGDGLAPFRAIDTYHMIYIAHYHRLSWKVRKQQNLPKLADHNDLPERTQREICADAEAGVLKKEEASDADWEFSVLTAEQQRKLVHHQNKFSKSHSYYRPHETKTHFAFPLKLLIVIVSLLDLHSCLQISLGAFTWGWSYHTRPPAITAVILSISITVNITAGVLISVGDKRTRKKDVLMRMARQGLTEEAMRKVEKKRREEGDELAAERLRKSVNMARLANARQGVEIQEEIRVKENLVEGTTYVKEKLKPYGTLKEEDEDSGSGSDTGGGSGNKRKKGLRGESYTSGESYETASSGRSGRETGRV